MRLDTLLRIAVKLGIPFILVFALYVQLHGDYGPGGGFQAGTIAAAGVILYAIIFGMSACYIAVPKWIVEAMMPLGVVLYAGVGFWGFVTHRAFLDFSNLAHGDMVHGQHWGVFLVELGVLITVFSTLMAIFYAFAGRGRP